MGVMLSGAGVAERSIPAPLAAKTEAQGLLGKALDGTGWDSIKGCFAPPPESFSMTSENYVWISWRHVFGYCPNLQIRTVPVFEVSFFICS